MEAMEHFSILYSPAETELRNNGRINENKYLLSGDTGLLGSSGKTNSVKEASPAR
jgi:hypothetical protein